MQKRFKRSEQLPFKLLQRRQEMVNCYLPPRGMKQIIVMSVFVRLSTNLSQEPQDQTSIFVHVACCRASVLSSGSVAIRHVLPVLWMTSRSASLSQQPRCNVGRGLTPLLRDNGCVQSWTTASQPCTGYHNASEATPLIRLWAAEIEYLF